MSATQKVGEEIRRVRNRMNLSQKDFGELIGKSENQIKAYEAMRTNITVDVIFKIAEVANIKPEELIIGAPTEKKEKTGWDVELRIYNQEDRLTVGTILIKNGYDVGQHKRQASPTGKTVNYFIHATDRNGNADTSK